MFFTVKNWVGRAMGNETFYWDAPSQFTARKKLNMPFAGLWSVHIVKNCDLGLENAALGLRSQTAFSRPQKGLIYVVSLGLGSITAFLDPTLGFAHCSAGHFSLISDGTCFKDGGNNKWVAIWFNEYISFVFCFVWSETSVFKFLALRARAYLRKASPFSQVI